jgi:HEAT repeat protein/predicted MPP superfamily phosphohydrolase/energy-coupling factor transporter ATP-binding protein EcfA2
LPAGKKVKTDFFITYHHDDELAARWIADVLLKVPYSLFMESWDFLPGGQPLEKIDYMLVRSCSAAVLVSERWLRAGVEPGTWQPVTHKYLGLGAPALLLLRIDSCDLQQALGAVVFTDLYGLKQGEAANRLLKAASAAALAAPAEEKKRPFPITPAASPAILESQKRELDLLLAQAVKHQYHMTLDLETEVEKDVEVELEVEDEKGKKTKKKEKRKEWTWEEVSMERVLTDGNHYLLVNPSGMGKTTFLTYAAGVLLDRTKDFPFLPLLTTCIAINQRSGSIGDFITGQMDTLYKNTQTVVVKEDWENLCILIDALDQARDVDDIVASLLLPNRLTHYKKAKIILSSRQNTADKVRDGFRKIRLKLPVDDEVRLYLGEENYKKLERHIQATRELVTVPVLLEMLRVITAKGVEAPVLENRAGLYTKFTKILLDQERNKPRFWQDSTAVHHFIENELEQALEKISFFSLAENKILEIEKEMLVKYCGTTEKKEALLNIGILLELFEDREQKVVFRHQSFQAFFAARYMYYRQPELFREITLDIRFFYSDVWYEVMRFFVGLEKDPEKAGRIIDTILLNDFHLLVRRFNQKLSFFQKLLTIKIERRLWLIFAFLLASETTIKEEKVHDLQEQLKSLLREKNRAYRVFFISNIEKFNTTNNAQRSVIVHVISHFLRDEYVDVRRAAAEALGKIGNAKDIKLLEPLLKDENKSVQRASLEAFGKIGTAKDIPLLKSLIMVVDSGLKDVAIATMGKIITSREIFLLESLLMDINIDVCIAAIKALGEIGTSDHIPLLKPLINNKDQRIRFEVAEVLGKIGTNKHIPLLEPLLSDEDWFVSYAAAEALGKIGTTDNISLLKPLFGDTIFHVPHAADEALGNIVKINDISILESLLRDTDSNIRCAATKALKKIGTSEHIPLLKNLLWDRDKDVRCTATEVLGKIGTAKEIHLLEHLLRDEDIEVRIAAAYSFGKIGNNDNIHLLEPLLRDHSEFVRLAAVKALMNIDEFNDIPFLKNMIMYDYNMVGCAAVEVLGKIDTSIAISLLEPLLKSYDFDDKIAAAKVLVKVVTVKDISLLKPLLKNKHQNVRYAAANALGKIGAAEHLYLLEPLLRDTNIEVSNASAEAIEAILKRSAKELRFTIPKPAIETKAGGTVIFQLQDFITHRIPSLHILHISDIHYSAENDPSITRIFHEFLKDIKKWREQHHHDPIHAICLTGDIAFSGQKDQYASVHERINEILQVTGCSKDNLFIIPGNHDVHEFNNIPEECQQIMDKALKDETTIDRLLNDFEKYHPFHDKFTHYYGYVETSGFASSRPETHGGKPKPWYSRRLKDFPVRIIGLNSALFCLKPYSERDKIRMGKRQLEEAYFHEKSMDTKGEELVLLLTHHPADWLRETEKDEYTSLMDSYSMVHLHGHTHKLDIKEVRSLSGSTYMLIGTGSIYGENGTNHINTYHIMTLDFEQQEIHIWGRRWEPGYGFWTAFADTTRNVFQFPKKKS